MITGFLTPSAGTAVVCGYDIVSQPLEAKRRLGYLPEGAPAYPDMTPDSFLSFIAELRGFQGVEKTRRVRDTLERVNLMSVAHQPIDTLSKGYKRRVGLAQAILHDPQVLILDEPTDGLDPNQKHEVRSLIRNMAQEKVIILSTHILEEVDAVCSRAMIIANGRLVVDGTPAELEAKAPQHQAVTLTLQANPGTAGEVRKRLLAIPGVRKLEALTENDERLSYRIYPDSGRNLLADIGQQAQQQQWRIAELHVEQGRLDDVFRQVTRS